MTDQKSSYLKEARAAYVDLLCPNVGCKNCEAEVKLTAIFTLERVIEVLWECARERCTGCRKNVERQQAYHQVPDGSYLCEAWNEQRRIAALQAELNALKEGRC